MNKTLLIPVILLAASADSCPADTIELRNGRIIHGKVVGELPAAGPIKVTFTGGGSLTIDPDKVLRVRRDSRCDFKKPPAKTGSEETRKPGDGAGRKPGTGPPKPEEKKKPGKKAEEPAEKSIEAKLEAEILRHVSELSRQRTSNRVRAEAALKRLGPAALPYLGKAARHPFALTRRAVVRIAAEAAGPAGDELLRAALEDKDEWVRRIAREALAKRRR